MEIHQVVPIACVEEIEPCLPFWVDRLGFRRSIEVPEGDRLGFVQLERDGVRVMLQSRASLERDLPAVAAAGAGTSTLLYVEVEDLAPFLERLEGVEVVVPERATFYGCREIYVRDPGGVLVGLAMRA